jgi:hypothetical protein
MYMNNWTFETIACRHDAWPSTRFTDDIRLRHDNNKHNDADVSYDNAAPKASHAFGPKLTGNTILNDAIINLEVLGKLSRGDILNTTDDYFTIGQKGWQSVITRTLLNDSRYRALNRIFRCIYTLTEAADHIRESKYLTIYDRMSTQPTDDDMLLFADRMSTLCRIGTTLRTACHGVDTFLSLYEDDVSLRAKAALLQDYIKNIEHNLCTWYASMVNKKETWHKHTDGQPVDRQ